MATRSWIVPGPARHDVEGVDALRVQLVAGSVSVHGHDSDHVHVEVAEVTGNPLEISVEGTRLSIGYPTLGWDGWARRLGSYSSSDVARLTVHVPHGTTVHVATATADATVSDVAEDLTLMTASAALRVLRCRGAATLRSASGTVEVSDHVGPVRVSTAAARTEVTGELPRTEVTSVAGSISVTTTAHSAMADLATVSGAMRVQLPAGTGLSMTARTVTGQVRVDGVDRRPGGLTPTTVEDRGDGAVCFLTTRSVAGSLDVVRGALGTSA